MKRCQYCRHVIPESLLRHGFTLIELLVVIAIISLLASILLPSLQQARELARSAVCMGNFRSFGIAHQMYCQDNNGNLMPAYYDNGGPWVQLIPPYADPATGVFRCPSDEAPVKVEKYHFFGSTAQAGYYSYGYNLRFSGIFGGGSYHTRNLSEFAYPSKAVMATDKRLSLAGVHFFLDINPTPWHKENSSFNIVFVDGHAEETPEVYKSWVEYDLSENLIWY